MANAELCRPSMTVSCEGGRVQVEVIPGDATHRQTVRFGGPAHVSQAKACAAVAEAIKHGGEVSGYSGAAYAEHALNVCLHDDDGEADLALALIDPSSERGARLRARYRAAIEQMANGEHKWP